MSQDDDPLLWSRHIKSSSNLRSLLSLRPTNSTPRLILHLLTPIRIINSDLARLFPVLSLCPIIPLVGRHPAELCIAPGQESLVLATLIAI